MDAKLILRLSLVLVGAIAVAVASSQVREKRVVASGAVDDIEAQLLSLDPILRASVIARLARDGAKSIHHSHQAE